MTLSPTPEEATHDIAGATLQGFRLSPQQARLWAYQAGAADLPYRARLAVELAGGLDAERLWRALEVVIGRHEILRTRFPRLPGMATPVQVVEEEAVPRRRDPGPAAGAEDAAAAWLATPAAEAVDCEAGPPLTSGLADLGDGRHLWTVELPALCADPASLGNLAAEVLAVYAGDDRGGAGEVLQYPDAAEWQIDLLESPEAETARGFWEPLAADLPAGALPFTRPAGDETPFRPRRRVARVTAATLRAALGAAGAVPGAAPDPGSAPGPGDALLAAWLVVLGRLAGDRAAASGDASETAAAVAFPGRRWDELVPALGAFARYLPLRAPVDPERPFAALATAVAATRAEAEGWQEYHRWPHPDAPRPVAPHGFAWLELPSPPPVAGLEARVAGVSWHAEPFVAHLAGRPVGDDAVELVLDHDASRLDAAAADLLLTQVGALLDCAAAAPEVPLHRLSTLGAAERRRLVDGVDDAGRDVGAGADGGATLGDLFAARAAERGEAVAVEWAGGRLTYDELEHRSRRLARHLRRRGVGAEARVALHGERSPELLVAWLAVARTGAAWVPLDPEHPPGRLAEIAADAGAALLLTTTEVPDELAAALPGVVSLAAAEAAAADEPDGPAPAGPRPDGLAYVLFTSGSSGRPKGVQVAHRAIVNRVLWMLDAGLVTAEDAVLWKTPYVFDASIWEVFAPLLAGARLVVAPPAAHRDMERLAATVDAHGVTVAQFVPSLLRVFLDQPAYASADAGADAYAGAGARPGASLRRLFCGGEELAPDLVAVVRRRLPGCDLHNLYGPTEVSIDATHQAVEEEAPVEVPIGVPLPNVRVYVVDDELRPRSTGQAGELVVAGRGLARGYLGRAAATATAFVPDPFAGDGGRIYRTGDRARWRPDGCLVYLGRADHQVKVRGVRVELGEVEELLRRLPGVRDAVAAARADGAGHRRLVAWVVAAGDAGLTPDALRRRAAEALPEALRPAAWAVLPELPRTAGGKVDRRALATPATGDEAGATPETATERRLAAVWAEVLERDEVGVDVDFFELGGDSILSLQVVNRAARDGLALSARMMFQLRTVRALAAALDAGGGAGGAATTTEIRPLPRDGELPLSFPQERLWFLAQIDPDSAAYNIPMVLDLEGDLDLAALRRALGRIVDRHEVLRTRLVAIDGEPRQEIDPPGGGVDLPSVDLGGLPQGRADAEVERVGVAQVARPFDLGADPMLRVCLLRRGPRRHRALTTLHHIAGDGWSAVVLMREIAALYHQELAGGGEDGGALEPLPYQYADYAAWQRRRLDAGALGELTTYWRGALAGMPETLHLPGAWREERPAAGDGMAAGVVYRRLPAAPTAAVRELARERGATLFMVLLAAFNVVLRHFGAGDDVVVGSDVTNRQTAESERLIGFFVNQIVLRTDLSGEPTLAAVVERSRRVAEGAFAHQEMPFARLVGELAPSRRGDMPLFQVKMVLQNQPLEEDVAAKGLELRPVEVFPGVAKFDLLLNLADTADGLACWLEYRRGLFTEGGVGDLLAALRFVLERLVAEPDTPLSRLDAALGERVEELRAERRQARDRSLDALRTASLGRVRRKAVRS